MQGQHLSRLKGSARVLLELCVLVASVSIAICWLSGWPFFGTNKTAGDNTLSRALPSAGGRTFALSPAVKEMMDKVGLMHSTCYEAGRRDPKMFLLCMGRADCAHAKKTGGMQLIAAPEALQTPEGKRKVLEVTHAVLTRMAQEAQTSDLRVMMEKVSALGLACDDFRVN